MQPETLRPASACSPSGTGPGRDHWIHFGESRQATEVHQRPDRLPEVCGDVGSACEGMDG